MKIILKHKLKGNSIMEVLIAMAILTFCSSLAVVIYLNIQKSSLPFFKVKAVEIAEQCMSKAIRNKEYTEESIQQEEFVVNRNIVISESYPDCFLLRILVFDNTKKKIIELEQTVFKGN